MAYTNPKPSIDDEKLQVTSISDAVDYKELNPVYFAFIDVLGFQKAFDDMRLSKNDKTIKTYSNVFKYYFALMNSAQFMKNDCCYAGQTSDSLYFYTTRSDFLWQFIKIISYFSLFAMSQNVFFRGGIAKGSLFVNQQYQYFGDSVINAYLLESKIAKNPVIYLDEKTFNDISHENEKENLITESGKRHYINPFYYIDKEAKLDLAGGTNYNKINAVDVRKNIANNMQIFEFDDKKDRKSVV